MWEHLSSTLSKFQLYNTVFSTIVTMFCIRSLDLIHIIAESLYPLTNLSLFFPSLATTFPFYEFDFFFLDVA